MTTNGKKKISLLTFGTTGDVMPLVALAIKLKQNGYDVVVAAGKNYKKLAEDHNINFYTCSTDVNELMQTEEMKEILAKNPLTNIKKIKAIMEPLFMKTFDETWEASMDSDAILYHPKIANAPYMAEKLNIPCICTSPVPVMTPTSAFP